MRILVIIPIITEDFIKGTRERVEPYVRADTEVDFVNIDYGTASIESEYDKALAAPFVIKKVEWAEQQGYDAVVISCMGDPGLKGAKQAVSIPVVGPGEAARQIAPILGEKVARVYPTGLTVLQLVEDAEKTFQVLLENGKKALAEGAQVLILSCTGLHGLGKRLQDALGVPTLEGEGLALGLAQMFVDVGITHSKRAYPNPPDKIRIYPQ
jgi:allantoin racemase